jgi:hypothetical protein
MRSLSFPSLLLAVAAFAAAAASVHADDKPAARATISPLMFGLRAPEIAVTDLDGKAVTLDSFKSKPVVLQFGSLTEPVFRKHAPDAEKLAGDLAGKVAFVVIYQKESHAADGPSPLDINVSDGFQLAAPASQDERLKLAKSALDRLALKRQTILVDAFNDTTSRRYGGRPNATFLLDSRGALAAAYPWFDPAKLRGAITATLADKPVPAEFQGPVRSETIPAAAFEGANGRLSIAIALDSLTLNDKQKQALYPVIAEMIADLREFRETRATSTTAPAKDADDLQTWLTKFRGDYDKVRTTLRENLSETDARKTLDALDRTLPPRLLNNMSNSK